VRAFLDKRGVEQTADRGSDRRHGARQHDRRGHDERATIQGHDLKPARGLHTAQSDGAMLIRPEVNRVYGFVESVGATLL
jgi:hypothetical protein